MPHEIPLTEADAYRFILENIDSVAQMEGLVLLWESRPAAWTCEELAARLYVRTQSAEELLRGLLRHGLIAVSAEKPERFAYSSNSAQQDELMQVVETTYRRQLVKVSQMIHSKASSSIREFARAFRFKKERDT